MLGDWVLAQLHDRLEDVDDRAIRERFRPCLVPLADAVSFDHLVGGCQKSVRYLYVECPCSGQVDAEASRRRAASISQRRGRELTTREALASTRDV
jgi:hypothetical protein